MEFKPLIDYSTPIKRKQNPPALDKAVKTVAGIAIMFFSFLLVLMLAEKAGYFN